MEKKYAPELVTALAENSRMVEEQGLSLCVKPIPDCDIPGAMDPRLYASFAPMFKGVKGFFVKNMMKRMGDMTDPDKAAQRLRRMMDGVKSVAITSGVAMTEAEAPNGRVQVPLRVYTPERSGFLAESSRGARFSESAPPSRKGFLAESLDGARFSKSAPPSEKGEAPVPVMLYIHGGGFVAGNLDVVDEMCRLFVQQTGYIAVSVDYRLAPENPYPAGLDDCYAALQWTFDNAARFGGDAGRVFVAGDSAGGNLATVCALRDRDEGGGRVRAQALIYPTVNMAGVEDENYHFSLDAYTIAPEHRTIVNTMLGMMGTTSAGDKSTGGLGLLLGADPRDPHLSPYLANLAGLPPAIILYGEHDFLRMECEAYARKLKAAGVPVKAVRYSGLGHGFADAVGVYPQAEDCLREIGVFMEECLGD